MLSGPIGIGADMKNDVELEESFNLDAERAARRFRYWNVESTLNRAADLLDRCLADCEIHRSFCAQGVFQKERIEDLAVLVAAEEVRNNDYAYNRAVRKRDTYSSVDAKHSEIVSAFSSAQSATDYGTGTGAGAAWHSAMGTMYQAMLARYLSAGEYEVLKQDVQFADVERNIAKNAVQRRRQLQQNLGGQKSGTNDGGSLNFELQALWAIERIRRDYLEAYDYCLAAMSGLRDVFGYESPTTLSGVYDSSSIFQVIGGVHKDVGWVRAAIQWVSAFTLSDQATSVSLSLRMQLPSWDNFIARQPCLFSIPNEVFGDLKYVRFRGISATSVFSRPMSKPLHCRFKLPDSGRYDMQTEAGAPLPKIVKQNTMPECIIGNVFDQSVRRTPDVAGTVSLANASPIPTEKTAWKIQLSNFAGADLTALDDVLLEIQVVGQQPLMQRYGLS